VSKSIVVVPCYNEARRLRADVFEAFAKAQPDIRFLLVNDGSTDTTLELLRGLEARNGEQFAVIDVQPNGGKAEAVRRGMLVALEEQPSYAGYWDADLATPLDEIPWFVEVLDQQPQLLLAMGSRVKLLGRTIERSLRRHYLGRVFATAASITLRLAVYDTQCGAKLFRCAPETIELFREPFVTGWIFDVELIARLTRARRGTGLPPVSEAICELPLHTWCDVAGSKVKPHDFFVALLEMTRIWRRYMRG
jgi:dolichyl-phosphate beta-glucosyltransferase